MRSAFFLWSRTYNAGKRAFMLASGVESNALSFSTRTRAGKLPLFLVLGIATSFDVLHQNLPRSSHAALSTRRFYLQVLSCDIQGIESKMLTLGSGTLLQAPEHGLFRFVCKCAHTTVSESRGHGTR